MVTSWFLVLEILAALTKAQAFMMKLTRCFDISSPSPLIIVENSFVLRLARRQKTESLMGTFVHSCVGLTAAFRCVGRSFLIINRGHQEVAANSDKDTGTADELLAAGPILTIRKDIFLGIRTVRGREDNI